MTKKTWRRVQVIGGVLGAGALAAIFTASYFDPYNACIREATADGMTTIVASRHCNQQLNVAGAP